jgi:putative ABC transport system permease protein
MADFWQDLRFSLRAFGKSPWFAFLAVVTLALGLAVNTTVFSVVNGLLLRPLPVPNAEQITVLALQQNHEHDFQRFSYPDYVDLKAQSDGFSDIFGYQLTLTGFIFDGKGDHCVVGKVTGNYFSALGIRPARGRFILPSEGQVPGADPIVVLGYSYWQKRFAGDSNVIGKSAQLDGHPVTIVGVAPKGFTGTYALIDTDLYVPLSAEIGRAGDTTVQDIWTHREQRSLSLLGRLKSNSDRQRSQASLNVVAERIAAQHPDTDKNISILVIPEKLARPDPDPDNSLPAVAAGFLVLAALVLLVACFNITNVLLVRATARQREMAIRAALGAGRGRLVRQYLTESLLLALLGGSVGMLLAYWATGFLSSLSLGTDLPIRLNFLPDSRVYLFALGVVGLTAVIVGLLPALRVARHDLNSVLHEGGRGSSDGPRRQWARNSLVAAQVAGSLVLLVVAGLFLRSLNKAQNIYLGFNPDHVLNLSLDVEQLGYPEERGREFYRELEVRLRSVPGVVSVAQAFTTPMGYISSTQRVHIPEQPLEPGKQAPTVSLNMVSPGYFDTLGIALHRGRRFTEADGEKAPEVAVINEAMAKKFWPNQDAVGKRFSIKGPAGPFIEVIGVVQDGKYLNVTETPQPFFYLPLEQSYSAFRTFHVRSSVPPESMIIPIESQVRQLAPNLPISMVQSMTQSLQGANGFFVFILGAQLTATMGLLGLILAVVGVYSVASYAASQRTHEIGIRMALGAEPRDIFKMVLRQGFTIVAIGMVAGLAIALAGTRVLADLIVGVRPSDPLTYAAVATLLLSVALFACWVPARRATRVSPLSALRFE